MIKDRQRSIADVLQRYYEKNYILKMKFSIILAALCLSFGWIITEVTGENLDNGKGAWILIYLI
jgi:hypothetical protein